MNFAESLARYEKLVATILRVDRKGAAMPYMSLNGHKFSFLTKTGKLEIRLPPEVRDAFLAKYQAKPCEQNGAVPKEYAEVPDALLKKTRELKKFFALSYAYVGAFKPKPTRRTKKAP